MSAFAGLSKVHEFAKVPGAPGGTSRLVRVNPLMRFSTKAGGPIYLQNGRFWFEGGAEVGELPDWLKEEIRKCSAEALQACGLKGAAVVAPVAKAVPEAETPKKLWTCGECAQVMELRKKGAHVANHTRKAK